MSEKRVAIDVVNRQRLVRIDRTGIAQLAARALEATGRDCAQMTVAFVRDGSIRDLNLNFRGKNQPTDVLSFPAADDESACGQDGQSVYLGDVVISTDTALRQAGEAKLSLERELGELIIHGILHLCGYDHETDKGEMNRLELKLRRRLLD